MQVHDPVSRQFWILVSLITNKPLAAKDIEVGAEQPRIGDPILTAELEAVVRNGGNVIAGTHENIAVFVSKGIVRRPQRQGVQENGSDRGEVGIVVREILFVSKIDFDAFAKRVDGVLTK